MLNEKMRIVALAATLLVGTIGCAIAQTNTTAPATTDTVARVDNDDDGFDLGWIGLLGLAGLAGLTRRRDPVVHHTTVGTGTPGSTRL